MKKIDVLKTNEKIKVSLALDSETFELIENSLAGFKLISMLAKSGADTSLLKGKNSESIFASITNRSEFISQIINTIANEKLFVLDVVEYSLSDMAKFFDDVAMAATFPVYINLPALYAIKNIQNHPFLTTENIEKMRKMNLEETKEFFFSQFSEMGLMERVMNSNLRLERVDNENNTDLPVLITEEIWKYYEDDYIGIEGNNILFGSDHPIDINDCDPLPIVGIYEPGNSLAVIEKRAKELIYPYAKRESLVGTDSDDYVDAMNSTRDFVGAKFYEMLNVLESKGLSEMTRMRILRNQLFNERNMELVDLLKTYIEFKLNLQGNPKKEIPSETADS